MKSYIYVNVMLLTLCVLMTSPTFAQKRKIKKANEDTKEWRYDIAVEQTGSQGSYLVKVWSYSKKPAVAQEQSKKNAVHGIIFKGFAGKPGVSGKKALVTEMSVVKEKAGYFDAFFADGGSYMKFVEFATNGNIAAGDRVKIGKEYKIGVVVSVKVAELRKQLEADGIIKALGAGF